MTRSRMLPASALVPAVTLSLVSVLLFTWAGVALSAVTRVEGGIRFTYRDAAAGTVAWAGDFNGWNATANPLVKGDGDSWSIVLALPAGEHSYKLVVDNNWIADPDNSVTKGEYGNSVITVAADGSLGGAAGLAGTGDGPPPADRAPEKGASAVRANTPYSAKLEFHGRGIGLYESFLSRENSRYELRRPQLNFDLITDIRISEVLVGRWLMKIDAEQEALDFYQTRLTFDRGNLTFRKSNVELFAYDNENAGTWDDPLNLVGNIGIYGYDYGYNRQGFRLRPNFGAFEAEVHYADNFASGGTAYPAFDPDAAVTAGRGFSGEPDGAGGYRLQPDGFNAIATVNVSDANEDMIALRLKRDFGPLMLGVLARSDRGFNLGSGSFVFTEAPDRLRALSGQFEQLWYAFGGEAKWQPGPAGLVLRGEGLFGRTVAEFIEESTIGIYGVTFDDSGAVADVALLSSEVAGNQSVVLDRSRRGALGGRWNGNVLGAGAVFDALLGYMDHDDRPSLGDLDAVDAGRRSMKNVRVRWDQQWGALLPRQVETIVDVEWTGFDYRADDPWDAQFWFAQRNFWLENGFDLVGPDRIVMLGGANVWSFRPEFRVPILPAHGFAFEYAGRIHTHSLTVRPKYIESFFRLGYDLTPALRLQSDTRWVKYDDPVLQLGHGYVNHFVEALYTFAPGVQVALSYGVDPWVLDRATNEYAYRGRDDALAAEGVTSTAARLAYLNQGPVIDAAERALRDTRRIAIEAIVRF